MGRGKRHGAFVWSKMDPISQKKFIEYYQRLNEQEGNNIAAGKPQSAVVLRSDCNKSNNNSGQASGQASGQTSPKRRNSSMPVRIQEPETKCETTQEKPVEKQEKTDENISPPKQCTEPIEQKETSTCETSGEKASQS